MKAADTTETPRPHIDVGGWPTISGSRVILVLEPSGEREDGIPRVYTFGHVGPGCPERVFHSRHYELCSVSTEAVPEELERIIEAHTDEILALDETYLGAEWDGHNHRGRWDLSEDERLYGYDEGALARDVADCPSYWSAADWFAGDPNTVIQNALLAKGLDEVVAGEIEQTAGDAYLDADDVRDWIVEQLRDVEVGSVVEEHLPVDDDGEETEGHEMQAYVSVDLTIAGEEYQIGCCVGLPEALHGSAHAAGTGVHYGSGYPTAWWADAADHAALPAVVDRDAVLEALRESADRLWDEVSDLRTERAA